MLRQRMPHTLLQMLLRGSNAVGYQNYPDNVLKKFIDKSAEDGVDVFRIFDSLNWVEQMQKSIEYVRNTGKIAEGTMCYTGDLLSPDETKYTLDYYKKLAGELVDAGAQILGIKDMAGLLKPDAAYELVGELKAKYDVPVHLHTHDTTGNGVATYDQATRAGVDVVDVAMSALSSTTSQPSMSSFYYSLEGNERQPELDIDNVEKINQYWAGIRPLYKDFANGINAPLPDIYETEMPGGQYSNLQQQAKSLGLDDFEQVKAMYRVVNRLLGDIVKVTPSSKVVGDLAIFMIQNNLTADNILERGKTLDFPESVVNFFAGDLGQPYGGFPKELQAVVLKGQKAITVRPGSLAKPVDFDQVAKELENKIGREPSEEEVISYVLYPDVFMDYFKRHQQYGRISVLDTNTFYQGMRPGETVHIHIAPGKTEILRLDSISDVDVDGNRHLFFAVDGEQVELPVEDQIHTDAKVKVPKADPSNPGQIGMPLNGTVVEVLVKDGDHVKKGDSLIVTEAMKMETTIKASFDGTVEKIYASEGTVMDSQDLLIQLKADEK